MRSKRNPDFLELEKDLPTTGADVEALRRHRPRAMGWEDYLRLLAALPPSPDTLRARPGPRGDQPFEL